MAAKKDTKAPQYRTINIVASGPQPPAPIIIDHWVILRKSINEEAEWVIHPQPTRFTVKFDKGDGSPFADDEFTSTDSVVSGPIVVEPQDPPKAYRYSLEVEGYDRIDPGVIIR
jgi:hypothetical protein